ncbi:MAG: DUF4846 domain-containing protein [Myxococcota bacterium]
MAVSAWLVLAVATLPGAGPGESLAERFPPPDGHRRTPIAARSFGSFLRELKLRPGRPAVHLFNGRPKLRDVHAAVLDIDVGARDLQQCADFAIRLHAEWRRRNDGLPCYRFTSGDAAPWSAWREGWRPQVRGRHVTWRQTGRAETSSASFRRWLDVVFTYAGSASLARDTRLAAGPVAPGDLYVQAGFPGHVVVVLDVVRDETGKRQMLLGQSYMPAQEPHVLRRSDGRGAWFSVPPDAEPLLTPEWRFPPHARRRFTPRPCAGAPPLRKES